MKCVRYLLVSPKGGSKSELFLFWNNSQLQVNEVCFKVSLRENFQRQSCSTFIPLSNGTQMLGETLTLQPEMWPQSEPLDEALNWRYFGL